MLGGLKVADPGVTAEPRGLAEATSRPADIFTLTAFTGRSAAPDVCVASSHAAAARGGAAQAAFGRKTSHYRRRIQDLRVQGICLPPVGLDG